MLRTIGSSALCSTAETLQAKTEKDSHWLSARVEGQMRDGSALGFPLPNMRVFA